jgi:cytochrome c-type biogenesis protein CcmH/NrfG
MKHVNWQRACQWFSRAGWKPVESDPMNQTETSGSQGWKSTQVYAMAVVCLIVGVVVGYLFRGSDSRRAADSAPSAAVPGTDGATSNPAQMPSLDDMKRMADKQAEPLLAKLKSDPTNSDLLNQIGTLYKATHQFQEAAGYYRKAVEADPRNVAARTDLASCLYYQGDADGAIQQLQQALSYQPADANSLFNLGIIRLEGKNDPRGAVTAWQQLLQSNPGLASDKKSQVEKLIADARKRVMTN